MRGLGRPAGALVLRRVFACARFEGAGSAAFAGGTGSAGSCRGTGSAAFAGGTGSASFSASGLPREKSDHFIVCDLVEIPVVETDREKGLGRLQADNVVNLAPQRLNGIGGSNRDR